MGKKINLGMVVSFGVGGADKVAFNLTKGLIELGEDINIMVFFNSLSHPRSDELFTNPSRYESYKHLPVKLIEFKNVNELNNYELDILHTHRSGDDNWFLPNFNQTDFNFKILETNFHGYNNTKSDFRVYPSNSLLDNIQPCKIPYKIIHNPINTPITNLNLREELGIKSKFVYGRIGRPDDNIYSNINISAYKQIESDDTCFLYIAPNDRARADATILGIKNIIFINTTSDELIISKIYNTFDVLCHSNSLGETFGNTIAEAMINSKPIITHIGCSSWTQAQKELVGSHQELFLTENIIDSYAALMLKLKNDKDYYNEVSIYLKNRADNLYDYIVVSRDYYNLYLKMLEQC